MQRDQVHVPDSQAALKSPRRTSQPYGNMGQNLYPDLCEIGLALISF